MEASPPKIYDIQLVINSFEIDGNLAKVLCLECCGTRMFLGTAEGYLLEYFITHEKAKTFFNRVRQVNLHKGQPILQIRNASALDTLITLTGGTLSMYDSQSMESKGNNVSAVTSFAVDENPIDGDPFNVSLCFAKKKYIVVAQASEKGFTFIKEISLDSLTLCVAIESGLCCVALATGKYVFVNTTSQRKSVQDLCEFDPKEVSPKVVHVGKEEFLVIGPGRLGVFVTSRGTSERPPIIWSEKINQLVVDGLNVVAVSSDAIYVSSLSDPGTSNLITFPGTKCLALSEGKLYVGTARSLYRFIPISVDEQVEALLASDKIDQAFSLLEMAHLKPETKEFLARKIHKSAIFYCLAEIDLVRCKECMKESNIDLREVLSLFPGILPSTTVFTRTLPALHNYADINQMTGRDSHKNKTLALFLLDVLSTHEPMLESKDLSTATIKLAAKHHKSKYILLLDEVTRMNIDYEDCFEWMEEQKMIDSLALLYKAKGDFKKALDTWISLLTKEIVCGEDDEFEGISTILETLLCSNDEQLVWDYYHKLCKIDANKALEIFTKRRPSPMFQPLEIAEKLSSDKNICRAYLTHCINIKKLEDEDLHTFLATLYIDQVLGSPKEQDTTEIRDQFRQFLLDSNCLKVQFLIGRLATSSLRLELAILHGKAGDHAPALKIIIEELHDHQFARDYCKKIHNESQRMDAFIDLFKTYLNKSDKTQLIPECLDVLVDFVEDFDISIILPMLPDEFSLSMISVALRRAVRLKVHMERQTNLMKGFSNRVNSDFRIALEAHNQGYQVDEDSVCGVCLRKFDQYESAMYNKGLVVHSKCV